MTQASENYLARRPHLAPVVDYVRTHPGCTLTDIRRDVRPATSPYDLRGMREIGLIRRSGWGRGETRWSA